LITEIFTAKILKDCRIW